MTPPPTTDRRMPETRQQDLELRRARGEISCAECRRLKLRCNKKVPCSSCLRRGCSTVCPNGTLSGGQGSRFILADTGQLHDKLTVMSERIRQLEDALEISHKAFTRDPHPLLRDELLAVKRGVQASDVPDTELQDQDSERLDAFGTLTISDGGTSRFLGRSGGSESLLVETEDVQDGDDQPSPQLPFLISQASESWPFSSVSEQRQDLLLLIEAHLPSRERASALCEAYLENVTWFSRPITRVQIIEDLLPGFYKRHKSVSDAGGTTVAAAHDLSLLLMVFALGAVADLTLQPVNAEAELYYQLARAALNTQPVLDTPSLSAVQALALMGLYFVISARKSTMETSWLTMNLALTLAISIGLHKDPARWNLHPKIVQRRRCLFWEIFATDNWQSIGNGRPTIFSLHSVDCEFPEDVDADLDDDGSVAPSFWAWKYKFAKEIVYPCTHKTTAAGPLKYSDILELDRKIREFESARVPKKLQSGKDWPMHSVKRYMGSSMIDILLIYIHRNFFAKALLEYPANPLRSRYAPSFLAAYRSSTLILKSMRDLFTWHPQFMARFWPIWAHGFSAAVMIGSIVTRGPGSSLAPAAFAELDMGVGLFEKAAERIPMAKRALPVLLRIREKAQIAYDQYCRGETAPGKQPHVDVKACFEDELAILSGKTRLISTRESSTPPTFPSPTLQSCPTAVSTPLPSVGAGSTQHDVQMDVLLTNAVLESPEQYSSLMDFLASGVDTAQAVPNFFPLNTQSHGAIGTAGMPPIPNLTWSQTVQSAPAEQQRGPIDVMKSGATPANGLYDQFDRSMFADFDIAPHLAPNPDASDPNAEDPWVLLMQEAGLLDQGHAQVRAVYDIIQE